MEKEVTNLNLRLDVKLRARKALEAGYFNGIGSFSKLVEKALIELMNRENVPKDFNDALQVQRALGPLKQMEGT